MARRVLHPTHPLSSKKVLFIFDSALDKPLFVCYIYIMKMNVTIKANDNSSRRTRNRISEHGPNFRALKSGNCQPLGNDLHWLVRSEDGWFGWLPWIEFNWTHVDLAKPLPRDDDFRDMMPDCREFYGEYAGYDGNLTFDCKD